MAHLAHQPLVDDDEPTTRLPNPWPLQRKVLVGAVSICAGLVLLAVLAKPAPTIHQKTALSCGSTVTGSTVRGPRHLGQASGDATFGFVVGTTTTVTFSTCAETNFDSYLHVYDQSLREIAFDDDGCGSGFRARLQTTLNPGSYTILVDGYDTGEGAFQLTVTCEELRCGSTVRGSTQGSPSSFGGVAGDASFPLNLERETNVNLSTCGSSFDTTLRILAVENPSTELAFNNDGRCDGVGSTQSTLVGLFPAGSYLVVVDGADAGSAGNFVLTMLCPSPSSTPSATESRTLTSSPSSTRSSSSSRTQLVVATSSRTPTPSSSSSISASSSPSSSPRTVTATTTGTPTGSRSLSTSLTRSVSLSESASATLILASRSPSSSPQTASATETATATPTASRSPSISASPSPSSSLQSATTSRTVSTTPSPTRSVAPSDSASLRPSTSPQSVTATATFSASPTPSRTPVR
eukprot:c10207_g1_i2.p1 GENE.c10207_g1_i2~~c10207_g1_i2.p1  ORF type:complete len:466 (+),score=46.47 c10207_g1_i2:69-1466(+)